MRPLTEKQAAELFKAARKWKKQGARSKWRTKPSTKLWDTIALIEAENTPRLHPEKDQQTQMNVKKKNQGISPHRYKDHPLELKFALAWQNQNSKLHTAYDTLAYLLDSNHSQRSPATPSDRDRLVANTIIQWLGSPVGLAFVQDVLEGT